MKHPVRDRFLMLLYALASLCASGALIAIVAGRITPDMLSGYAAKLRAFPALSVKIAMIVIAVVLIVLGLSLISAMFPPKKKRSSSFAIQQNENGTVRISLKTIDALVQKCLSQHSELKVVTSSLFSDEETVRVDVHIVLLADISMPLAISALQKQITKYVEACSGVNVREVRVFVDGAMASGEKAAQSKYALPAVLLGGETESEEQEDAAKLPCDAQEMEIEETDAVGETPAAEDDFASVKEEVAFSQEAAAEQMQEAGEAPDAQETAADVQMEPAAEEAAENEDAEPVQEATQAQEASCDGAEEAPVHEDLPALEDEAPVVHKKKLFGIFGKK